MSGSIPAMTDTNPTRILRAIRDLFEGRSNAVGEVTLRASQTTTTVTAPNVGAGSKPQLTPKTSNAAAALASTYVSTVSAGSFVITHASNAQTDKTFLWVALG